jgi:hypothetical protein
MPLRRRLGSVPAVAAIDLVAVVVFVAIGRSVHHHGLNLSGWVSTAWPFLIGLAAGWLLARRARRQPAALSTGFAITIVTVAVGMFLRVVAGQGTAVAFVLVALGFLGAVMSVGRVLAGRLPPAPGASWRGRG